MGRGHKVAIAQAASVTAAGAAGVGFASDNLIGAIVAAVVSALAGWIAHRIGG